MYCNPSSLLKINHCSTLVLSQEPHDCVFMCVYVSCCRFILHDACIDLVKYLHKSIVASWCLFANCSSTCFRLKQHKCVLHVLVGSADVLFQRHIVSCWGSTTMKARSMPLGVMYLTGCSCPTDCLPHCACKLAFWDVPIGSIEVTGV